MASTARIEHPDLLSEALVFHQDPELDWNVLHTRCRDRSPSDLLRAAHDLTQRLEALQAFVSTSRELADLLTPHELVGLRKQLAPRVARGHQSIRAEEQLAIREAARAREQIGGDACSISDYVHAVN
jgi:hypothetical protein